MKKTGAILATILTSLFIGIPGIILVCMGLIAIVAILSPGTLTSGSQESQSTLLGGAFFLCGGSLMALVPIVVGFVSLRKKRGVPVASYAQPAYAPPAQPVYAQPAQPIAPVPAPSQPYPAPGMPTGNPITDITSRLMALNRPTAPYRIIDGRAENVDLIAEWKIVDARWYEVFAKAKLTKVFRIYMKFDPARRELRAMDREFTVQWRAGIPSISAEASFFKGQKSSISFGIGAGFTENLAPGVVYKYKFNTNELKQPIQQVLAASGWSYKGVAFGRL